MNTDKTERSETLADEIRAWCELDVDHWHVHSRETDAELFEHITKYQTKNHFVTLFPLYTSPAPASSSAAPSDNPDGYIATVAMGSQYAAVAFKNIETARREIVLGHIMPYWLAPLAAPAPTGESPSDAYHELIYAVSQKHEGETRHQTALRYIRQAEEPKNTAAKESALAAPAASPAVLTDADISDIADKFKSQYKHGGTTFDEFDAEGFARAIERHITGQAGGEGDHG